MELSRKKRLGVSGRIIAITQQEQALHRFFFAAPVIPALAKYCEQKFSFQNPNGTAI